MTERIIDIAESSAVLTLRLEQLVIARGEEKATCPVEEVGVLVVSSPAVMMSQKVLAAIMAQGGVVIICDEKHMPSGMMLPLAGHHLQTERLSAQVNASEPTRKRLWAEVVRAKVEGQGKLLRQLHGDDFGILAMAKRIRSGDTDNIEGQAARRYWPALMGAPDFRRGRTGPPPNALLNYGYAILRAMVARAVCAAGLHPSIGLHHHNRYDAFCLADDLMEPFRPVVDAAVLRVAAERGPDAPLDRETKTLLLAPLIGARFPQKGESRTLFDLAARLAVSLARAYGNPKAKVALPELFGVSSAVDAEGDVAPDTDE